MEIWNGDEMYGSAWKIFRVLSFSPFEVDWHCRECWAALSEEKINKHWTTVGVECCRTTQHSRKSYTSMPWYLFELKFLLHCCITLNSRVREKSTLAAALECEVVVVNVFQLSSAQHLRQQRWVEWNVHSRMFCVSLLCLEHRSCSNIALYARPIAGARWWWWNSRKNAWEQPNVSSRKIELGDVSLLEHSNELANCFIEMRCIKSGMMMIGTVSLHTHLIHRCWSLHTSHLHLRYHRWCARFFFAGDGWLMFAREWREHSYKNF